MAEKVTFKVSAEARAYLRGEKSREERLLAAAGRVRLSPKDLLPVVYFLCHDGDPEVKRTALSTLRGLRAPLLSKLLSDRELHPRILDALVQLHFDKPELAPHFAVHPMLSEKAAVFLMQKGIISGRSLLQGRPAGEGGELSGGGDAGACSLRGGPAEAAGGEAALAGAVACGPRMGETKHQDLAQGIELSPLEAPAADAGPGQEPAVDEESEEFKSKYQMAQGMGVAEKIKVALTGDKEWRSIMIKDSNKLVSVSVVRNPRITDGEVLAIAKSSVQNEEIMRVICSNKEWVKNPSIRKALTENNKTPIAAALRFVATLSERDLSMLAKNKNVASVVASQARRLLMTKKDGR